MMMGANKPGGVRCDGGDGGGEADGEERAS